MKNIREQKINREVMQFFASLADETRLKIILSIAEKPRSVNEIHNFVGKDKMTLSAISHQLKTLSDTGIIFSIKKGKEKYFELSDKFCWCVLRDAFSQFNSKLKIKCKKCGNKGALK